MFCIGSLTGQEEFFLGVGAPIATRKTPPPKLDEKAESECKAKTMALSGKYKTEFLQNAGDECLRS